MFAKTDVQNLLSQKISLPDIAASVFNAIALQIKNTLMKGNDVRPGVIFSGGPLSFISNLRKSMLNVFRLNEENIINIESPQLVPAYGAAIASGNDSFRIAIDDICKRMNRCSVRPGAVKKRATPLFKSNEEKKEWLKNKNSVKAPTMDISKLKSGNCILGIDSGSTTTKIVLTDRKGNIAFKYYANNDGDPVAAVENGIRKLITEYPSVADIELYSSAVTGYGEELIRSAFNLDYGVVETIAHFTAAKQFSEKVSFILDIGGQDMKAIYVENGIIKNIEINEACSSGCGSFIETFADSLGHPVHEFAALACNSTDPCNLGTRCTVFMNSKVKQSFREGAGIEDISAGLAYSVIDNCLHKVLRIHNPDVLGKNIIVQGGTFKNPAIHKAFENKIGRQVTCPDISELMGAYGAALYAAGQAEICKAKSINKISDLKQVPEFTTRKITCSGCENQCGITRLKFANGNVFYTGNRCEKLFSSKGRRTERGFNLTEYKYKLLFARPMKPEQPAIARIGLPEALNMFENFPFWATLLRECGFEVVLSGKSNNEISDLGAGTVMSDNICYPAKLAHGHIIRLIEKKVDRIFYPMVIYETKEEETAINAYNCPVVSGYPDLIRKAVNPEKHNIHFDTPTVSFKDLKLLKRSCKKYLSSLGITPRVINKAFNKALQAKQEYRDKLLEKGNEIIVNNISRNKRFIVLSGRPYHIDTLVNHNIPEMIVDYGLDVVTEDALDLSGDDVKDIQVLTQWAYPNRIYRSAKHISKLPGAEYIQLNSFGCGPDTIVIDETREILESRGKNHTVIRIDEHTGSGSLRLRIRSLAESIRLKDLNDNSLKGYTRKTTKLFQEEDRKKKIIVPFFSPFHSAYITATFSAMGYDVEVLPESDDTSVELGLKYVNNEICYPATLVIGDILKAIKSGKYDLNNLAVGISQTGGQCRDLSSYLPLLKKSLVSAGYENIPVIAASVIDLGLNEQPGFKSSALKLISKGAIGVLFGDSLSRMYHSIAPREKQRGSARKISDKYSDMAADYIKDSDLKGLLNLLSHAVDEFNSVELEFENVPKIGLVGEIFVKYNPAGNFKIVDRLVEERIEVVTPPLINLFIQWFVNVKVKNKALTDSKPISAMLSGIIKKYYMHSFNKFDTVLKKFNYYEPWHDIEHIADNASKVMNLVNLYFGEGWMIAGDILAFAEDNIKNVLCLQPFGCIANHVIARGMEKPLKDIDPELSILFLDIDSGMSEANTDNRVHLLVKRARNGFDKMAH